MAKCGAVDKTRKEFSHTVSFSCKPCLFRDMSAYVEERGCSRSWFLNKALENYLQECFEDREDALLADSILDDFEARQGKTVAASDLWKELGI